jgi:hypothetical protein
VIESRIKPVIKAALRHTLSAAKPSLDTTRGQFCLLSVDAIVDSSMGVHLTGISRCPPVEVHKKLLDDSIYSMIRESLEIVGEANGNGQKPGGWISCLENFEFLVHEEQAPRALDINP